MADPAMLGISHALASASLAWTLIVMRDKGNATASSKIARSATQLADLLDMRDYFAE